MPDLKRAVTFTQGVAMVITDLHGNGGVWQRLRDEFLRAHEAGEVQSLIMCGDLIHSNSPDFDDSLSMVLDVMRLQADLGPDTIVMLCGNHEMPHIYGMTLARGDHAFHTPADFARKWPQRGAVRRLSPLRENGARGGSAYGRLFQQEEPRA